LFELIIGVFLAPWIIIVCWWYLALGYYLRHREESETTSDFGIKILTLGKDVEVLKKTVAYCKKKPLIISKTPIEIEISNAQVEVVPRDFQCNAQFKGRDLEWARRKYPFDYTLYLDEDSLCDFEEIPVADIVQFQEVPIAKNLFIAAIEAHRIGFQIEQAFFEKTGPLYLWGGGFAIKRWLEDKITWDRMSITEDIGFIFSINIPYKFKFSKKKIYSQAPLRIRDLIKQRWRWASGIYQDAKYLRSKVRKAFVYFRTFNWGFWIVYATLLPIIFPIGYLFTLPMFIQAMIWSAVGTRIMKLSIYQSIIVILITPVAAYINSLGALLAVCRIQKQFNVTPKS
jgi:hypothetical protein